MKRKTYAIPAASLALTGCADPIVGSWQITNVDGQALPINEQVTIQDANGVDVTCTFQLSYDMVVNEEFALTISYAASYSNCTDANYNYEYAADIAGAVTVVEKKAQYDLVIDGDTLNCAMEDNVTLNCSDVDGLTITMALVE
jgi:hypothetical protein